MKCFQISILKTLYFNFRYLKFKEAIKFPVIVSRNTKLKLLKNSNIKITEKKFANIKIGFGNVGIFDKEKERTMITNRGTIVFEGKANIGHGTKISCDGILEFGDKFEITSSSKIWCNYSIKFGKNVLISWDNLFMDTDGHQIRDTFSKEVLNPDKKIVIGDNIWIGCRNTILKGTKINSNNIISSNNRISGEFIEKNCIIGTNLEIKRKNVFWT